MSSDPDSYSGIFDRAAATYETAGVPFFDVFGPRLVELAMLQTSEDVLDLGTGRGAALFPAATAVGPSGSATGLDLAPGMVERTAADAAASGWGHVRIHCGDAAHPPVEEASYDAVLAAFVLFFLDDPGAVLRRWARLLRPGGRLGLATFMSDPDDDLFARLLREFVEAPDQPPAPSRGPTSFELVRDPVWLDRSLTDAGLATIEVHELRHAVVLEGAEQWWRWGMSHGLRGALERVPEGRRQEAIAAAQRLLEGGRRSDGTLGVDVRVRFTVARRRPPPRSGGGRPPGSRHRR